MLIWSQTIFRNFSPQHLVFFFSKKGLRQGLLYIYPQTFFRRPRFLTRHCVAPSSESLRLKHFSYSLCWLRLDWSNTYLALILAKKGHQLTFCKDLGVKTFSLLIITNSLLSVFLKLAFNHSCNIIITAISFHCNCIPLHYHLYY